MSHKGPARDRSQQFAKLVNPRLVLSIRFCRLANEALKVCAVDLSLSREIVGQRLAGEETIETLAICDVLLAVEEDKVLLAKKLDCVRLIFIQVLPIDEP